MCYLTQYSGDLAQILGTELGMNDFFKIPLTNKVFVCSHHMLWRMTQCHSKWMMKSNLFKVSLTADQVKISNIISLLPRHHLKYRARYLRIDLLHKFHNAPVPYSTMHHFVTEMCTCVHISVTKWFIVGCSSNGLWDLSVYEMGVLQKHS